MAKKRLPHMLTIAGGAHPTLLAGDLFENLPELDIVLQDEGLPDLLEELDRSNNQLTIGISPEDRSYAFGWQRRGLPGRWIVDAATGSEWLEPNIPAFEIRVYRKNDAGKLGELLLVGF